MKCPHCGKTIRSKVIKRAAAELVRAAATASPTPKKLSPCKYCRLPFGARDMRAHIPKCESNPNRRDSSQRRKVGREKKAQIAKIRALPCVVSDR
jgi:hypothetical protein